MMTLRHLTQPLRNWLGTPESDADAPRLMHLRDPRLQILNQELRQRCPPPAAQEALGVRVTA